MAASSVLWLLYGLLLIQPLGAAVAWREELGYSEILQTGPWLLYSLPGVLAVAVSAWAGLMDGALRLRNAGARGLRPVGRGVLRGALGLTAVAIVGMALHLDPLVTGGLAFGTLSVGLGMLLEGLALKPDAAGPRGRAPLLIIVVGLLGILSLATWPLVYAVRLLPLYALVVVYAAFAVCWAVLAVSIWKARPRFPSG